jgi:hypothetical protein
MAQTPAGAGGPGPSVSGRARGSLAGEQAATGRIALGHLR